MKTTSDSLCKRLDELAGAILVLSEATSRIRELEAINVGLYAIVELVFLSIDGGGRVVTFSDTDYEEMRDALAKARGEHDLYADAQAHIAEFDAAQDRIRRLEATVAKVRQLAGQWSYWKYDDYVPPEDGSAAEYATESVRGCAEELIQLLEESNE